MKAIVQILKNCGLIAISAALAFSQAPSQGNRAKGGANNLIQPLAELEGSLKGKLERITVHAKSLEGNLEGDSPDRDVFIYRPPSLA